MRVWYDSDLDQVAANTLRWCRGLFQEEGDEGSFKDQCCLLFEKMKNNNGRTLPTCRQMLE